MLHARRQRDPYRARLWSAVFLNFALAAGFGAAAHGLQMPPARNRILWHPLYACLNVSVALMAAVATYDRWGLRALRRAARPLFVLAALCFIVTRSVRRSFPVFIVYETLTMLYALMLYCDLVRRARPGALATVVGIALTMLAALVQSSRLRARIWRWEFDHNGLFHLVQLVALPLIAQGALTSVEANSDVGFS
ncbi:hypothetical protein HC891_05540 [Candidatus Gracilibacteria bacterium]|nr:hypothetical protein [Candidatus Gracilibacteria bacterium]